MGADRLTYRHSSPEGGRAATDAKDVAVIADQLRVHHTRTPLRADDETVTDLKTLTGRRMDLVAYRTRTVNRLRAQLTGVFPGLERALELTNTGPLTLLSGYQTPTAIRRIGSKRLETCEVTPSTGVSLLSYRPRTGHHTFVTCASLSPSGL
ncbi:transposase [Streptomyces sp. NPDC001852]|uniref:IS110 family transposase n=1 Tax=Streptomyces sp. NPDC001852 TaxID=3364619 RepID=UPI0036737129